MADKVVPLEQQVTSLREELHKERVRLTRARDVLKTLLEFEPALRRYRSRQADSWGWHEEQYWDLEKLNRARYFREMQAAAEEFAEPVLPTRPNVRSEDS